MLEPSWVGRRVSVRRVLPHDPPRTADVVGDLLGLDANTAVIESRQGLVEISLDAVTHAKAVPASTAAELALEAVAARGLRAEQTEQLGGWLLRADHGFTSRANSALPLRQAGMPLDDILGTAHDWYAERGLPLRIHVPVEARRLLDADLGERGWDFDYHTHVYVRRLESAEPPVEVEIDTAPSDEWLGLYRGGRGTTPTGRALLTRHDQVGFAQLRRDGLVVAVGRGAVDDGWLGVMAVEVEVAYRRHGLARVVMAALSHWGEHLGATRTYLQVAAANPAAIALYESLGYWRHHDYHYRVEPAH